MTDVDRTSPAQAPAGLPASPLITPAPPAARRSFFRHWRWFVLGACASVCALSMGSNLWYWLGPRAWQPRVTCAEPVFDFGERRPDETIEHAFVLANTGGESVEIRDVLSSCGCITPPKTSLPAVAPGGRVEVPIAVTLRGLRGRVQKQVLVRSNDPRRPTLVLTVTGTVRSNFRVEPERVALESSEVRQIRVTSVPGHRIRAIRSGGEGLVSELRAAAPGEPQVIEVRAAAGTGAAQGRVELETTDDAEPRIVIPVSRPTERK